MPNFTRTKGWERLGIPTIDLFDRKVIGWSFSCDMTDDHTTIAVLNMALKRRAIHSEGLIFHSDRGVQYTSQAFIKILKTNGITQSMSRKANCWDNKNRRHAAIKNLTIDEFSGKQKTKNRHCPKF